MQALAKSGIAVVAACIVSATALAQSPADYPVKPIRVIVGQAPGGGTDIQTRLFAQKLTEAFGRPVIVENRTGLGSVLSYRTVAQAPPDGYTLLGATGGFTIAPAVHANLGFDLVKDLAPISLVVQAPFLLVVHPSLPVRNVKDLIALARSKPGALTHASAGQGSSTHLAAALFTTLARIQITHVPYKGTGPALVDVMSGQVHMLMGNVLSSLQHARSGRVRALAVTTATRSRAAPDIPTMEEAGVKGYESSTWHGWLAPGATPPAIIAKLNAELAKSAKAADVIARLTPDGAEPVGSSPEQFRQFIVTDIARWKRVVAEAGIKLE